MGLTASRQQLSQGRGPHSAVIPENRNQTLGGVLKGWGSRGPGEELGPEAPGSPCPTGPRGSLRKQA